MKEVLIFIVQALPLAFLSRIFGIISRISHPHWLSLSILRFYTHQYQVDLGEAGKDLSEYKNLNEFFTRSLKPGIRPLASGRKTVVCPVDGLFSAYGTVNQGTLIQAKGRQYLLNDLLLNCQEQERFIGGSYCLLYLSPKDCHRIFSPYNLEVLGYTYIPGKLLPVNEWSIKNINKVFVRNERLITFLSYKDTIMACIMIGATNVGSFRVHYDKNIRTNYWNRSFYSHRYQKQNSQRPKLETGQEFGYFEMGSSVLLLFEKDSFVLAKGKQAPLPVRYGEKLGELKF